MAKTQKNTLKIIKEEIDSRKVVIKITHQAHAGGFLVSKTSDDVILLEGPICPGQTFFKSAILSSEPEYNFWQMVLNSNGESCQRTIVVYKVEGKVLPHEHWIKQ